MNDISEVEMKKDAPQQPTQEDLETALEYLFSCASSECGW